MGFILESRYFIVKNSFKIKSIFDDFCILFDTLFNTTAICNI